jgi:hypothetical protein
VPGIATTVLPDASHHALPSANPGALNERLLGFLT